MSSHLTPVTPPASPSPSPPLPATNNLPSLWTDLDPARRTNLAQLLAMLLRRRLHQTPGSQQGGTDDRD